MFYVPTELKLDVDFEWRFSLHLRFDFEFAACFVEDTLSWQLARSDTLVLLGRAQPVKCHSA